MEGEEASLERKHLRKTHHKEKNVGFNLFNIKGDKY